MYCFCAKQVHTLILGAKQTSVISILELLKKINKLTFECSRVFLFLRVPTDEKAVLCPLWSSCYPVTAGPGNCSHMDACSLHSAE